MIENFEAEFPLHEPRPGGAPMALEGLRVVDFTHFIAGPFATMMMADMGADVIKIEATGRGDEFRYYPPCHPGDKTLGAPYLWANRNKRSIAVNLKSAEGVALVCELIASADVVAENFSTGVMERFGLDYEACRKLNPKIIYCSVSAYGREGAFADRLGFDPIVQAESGFVSMNGYSDREGVRALSPVMDISTAMMVCNAVLGALLARSRTGVGQAVEVALFDNALLMTGYASLQYLFSGTQPQRHGNTSPDTCPSGVFHAADRAFYINCGNDKIFQRLMLQVIERPDLAADPGLIHGSGRIARRDELFRVMEEAFGCRPWSHWQPRLREASVPSGELRSVGEALRSPESRERALVTRIAHPQLGWLPNIRLPIRYSEMPMADPVAAPAIGQHSEEVLREVLHYGDDKIAALVAAGAVGVAAPVERAPQPAEAGIAAA